MAIAKKGDPYVSPKGQVLLPANAFDSEENSKITIGPPVARAHVTKERRSMSDMPADPKTQTAIMVVLGFSLCGFTDNEIAHSINVNIADIQALKQSQAYQETFDIIFHEMISANSNSMLAKIAHFAPTALENMLDLAVNAKHDMAKVKANQDVLDRAGLHPEVLHGRYKATDTAFDSLKIVFEDGDEKKTSINVDIGRRK